MSTDIIIQGQTANPFYPKCSCSNSQEQGTPQMNSH